MEQDEEKTNNSKKKPKYYHFWDFRISKSELKYQVENYSTLKITQSFKGISVLVISFFLIISLIASFFFKFIDQLAVLIGLLIYIPMLVFVYKGHRWAIILLMILYTIDRGCQIYYLGGDSLTAFVLWILVTVYLWKALKVENERRKRIT